MSSSMQDPIDVSKWETESLSHQTLYHSAWISRFPCELRSFSKRLKSIWSVVQAKPLAWNEHKMSYRSYCCDCFLNKCLPETCKKCFQLFEIVSPALPLADFITDIYTVYSWKTLCNESDSTFNCLWWKLGKFNAILYYSILKSYFLLALHC